MDATVVDSEKWVISGITLKSPLKPIFTKSMEKREAEEEEFEFSTTPKSAESRIPTTLTCPPAPKKRKPAAASKCNNYREARQFFFSPPPDWETMFKRIEGA